MINLTYLKNKRIVITGGKGFLGKHVFRKLEEAGCSKVFVADLPEYDLIYWVAIESMLRNIKPDVIIHLAAVVGGIGANVKYPGKFMYENLMMGAQLIHYAMLSKVDKFVSIGTVCAYPKDTPVPFKEEDIWNGYPEETNAPYGLAKKMLMVQGQAYRKQYGFNAITLFPVNLYGPGDNFDPEYSHVIPALIKKFVDAKKNKAESVEIWGTGKASREFLYVEDAAEGIILAADMYSGNQPVNLGSGREILISELAKLIACLVGYYGKLVWNTDKPDGQPRRCLDTKRAKAFFNFKAKTNFNTGLHKTIRWYLRENKNARD